jgi:hypothetical protein
VTASGDGDGSIESRLTPLVLAGVKLELDVPSSGARKRTLIFFSWIEDFDVCSMCDHYESISLPLQRVCVSSKTYQRPDVGELLIGRDENGLHEELIAAFRIWRRVFLHGLEEDWAHVSVCCKHAEK